MSFVWNRRSTQCHFKTSLTLSHSDVGPAFGRIVVQEVASIILQYAACDSFVLIRQLVLDMTEVRRLHRCLHKPAADTLLVLMPDEGSIVAIGEIRRICSCSLSLLNRQRFVPNLLNKTYECMNSVLRLMRRPTETSAERSLLERWSRSAYSDILAQKVAWFRTPVE